MNSIITYGIIFVILLALELIYFKVADKFNIIDKPNEEIALNCSTLRWQNHLSTRGLGVCP